MSQYQQARIEIEKITDEERTWIEPYMDDDWWQKNHEEEFRGFDMWYNSQGELVIANNEHIYIDNVCWFLRLFLATWRPKSHVVLEYCWTGDDEHGGAAALVTAKSVVHFNPYDMAREWQKTGACTPVVEEHKDAIDVMEEAIDDEGG